MGDQVQITIPDFGEEDYFSAPAPFGRSAFGGFGGITGAGPTSGQESPVFSTHLASQERFEKITHSRNDSIASEDSSHSTRHPSSKSTATLVHSSQSSIATTSTSPFSKKPSFASLRNVFKHHGKQPEAPPVPQIDHQSSPVLEHPSNRSASSLNQVPAHPRRPSVNISPPNARSQTIAATTPQGDVRVQRSRTKTHTYGRSQQSISGSVFLSSDTGSDPGHNLAFSPPPVPRVPGGYFGHMPRSETPQTTLEHEDKVVMDPRTPSDYALHAVFIRFATAAEVKIDTFLRLSLDSEHALYDVMGPDVDPKFDETLLSLGKIAQKHAKAVVDSIMRWRRTQNEPVGSDFIRLQQSQARSVRAHEIPPLLNERKSLASIYIMCRALIALLKSISSDALGDSLGYSLEETTFEQFRKPDLKLLAQSANHRSNAELYASLLGHLANIRFMSVADKFLAELSPVASGQVLKDQDSKYENLVSGLSHIQIKVWPNEAFVEGAEFMASLAKAFENAHGLRLKTAFARSLVQLLHPIGKSAQDDVNDPQWQQAIEIIFPKAKDMMNKPRYWHVAYPLVITSLCVAPHKFFLKHWPSAFEASVHKLKEKQNRVAAMNGIMRLLWTYLYRSREPASTVTTKLDSVLKSFFPVHRLTVVPNDEHLEPLIYIVHFILIRHFEYGRDLCLELLQETSIKAAQGSNVSHLLAPERMTIAIQAILLSLHLMERDEHTPAWPSSTDFSVLPAWEDYLTSSDFAPPSMLAKSGIHDMLERCGPILAIIAVSCGNAVVAMSVFDDQWSTSKLSLSFEEAHNYVTRRHAEGSFSYPNSLIPQVGMLQTCFQSWPRCLHPSLPIDNAIDMLLRGIIHIEPVLGDVAYGVLKRFMADPQHALAVLSRYSAFLFNPKNISQEGSGTKFTLEHTRLLGLWVNLVDEWVRGLVQCSLVSFSDEYKKSINLRINEIEAGSLFMLSHDPWPFRSAGVNVFRMLAPLVAHLSPKSSTPTDTSRDVRIVELLHGTGISKSFLTGFEDALDESELERIEKWRRSALIDIPLRIAESTHEKDRRLWRFIFPTFIQIHTDQTSPVVSSFREVLVAAATRYHPFVSHLAGLSSRVPAGLPARNQDRDSIRISKENTYLVDQWQFWLHILCAMAIQSENSRPPLTQLGRDHSRVPSDANFDRERMTTTRGLFRYLTPFLDSEYPTFREAAVLCISSLPSSAYPQLLEDLSLLAARQFYDESRTNPAATLFQGRTRRQERFYSAVARIYNLTAPFLQHERSAGIQAALATVLKFVRNAQAYLMSPESRDNWALHRLRRYFCGTVELLFDGLAALKDSDRFIPSNMHLSLYRLCEEWCQFGPQTDAAKQRLILMQRACTAAANPQVLPDSAERFQKESALLSGAAIGALASLCQKAYFPPEMSATAPEDRSVLEATKPLDPSSTLERWCAILSADQPKVQSRARKALISLFSHGVKDERLLVETMRRALVTSNDLESCGARFFSVVSEVICTMPNHGFSFCQVVCLGLSNLCHPLLDIRRHAFNIIETIHEQSAGILSMAQFQATVGSSSPSIYLNAHRLISDFLGGEHPLQAAGMLSQFTTWLSQIHDGSSGKISLQLLQTLERWVSNIDLMTEDKSALSREGHTALYHLITLTLRFGHSHAEQILTIWTRLVDSPHQSNGHATARFLLEQSHKVGSGVFISCAANIVACLSQTSIGRTIFEDLCSVIEPARMLPNLDHKLAFPDAEEMELWSNLDALFADQPRISLGAAQYALLFLADVALERQWEAQAQLPILLHAIFTHLDHKSTFVRRQAQRMLFQLLRSWAPGYDELPNRSEYPGRLSFLATLERDAQAKFWKDDESSTQTEPKMKWLCKQTLDFLEPLSSRLTDRWGSLALTWGTACSIRAVAFRSLQIFRALMPRVTKPDLALLLGRLSNTIAAPDDNIQSFTSEILTTLNAVANTADLDTSLLPQMFWSAYACLSTTVESEFAQILSLLDTLLKRIDLDDTHTADLLSSHQPVNWVGTKSLQSSLLSGLRSSKTSDRTLNILQVLAKFQDGRHIDDTNARLRDVYAISLPWFLYSMSLESQDDSLQEFALNIAHLAEKEGRESIARIMTSFAKSRFRTKDDFLRQSVACLREHYGADHWTEIVSSILGLVLNSENWLRIHSMQVLKLLFQRRDARNPAGRLGSELLMPLLRLLESELAPQALDVLEEPITISGGPAARHVLRMSMHIGIMNKDMDTVGDIFGAPDESGWCVARPDSAREICRANVIAVFDTCKIATRPSRIDFEPEVEALADTMAEEDLGGLVQNLHELTTYFQQDRPPNATITMPSQQIEARVAAILAKSTAQEAVTDVPPTPFLDVFRVESMAFSDGSEEASDTDSEDDAFIFDSLSIYRNGRAH